MIHIQHVREAADAEQNGEEHDDDEGVLNQALAGLGRKEPRRPAKRPCLWCVAGYTFWAPHVPIRMIAERVMVKEPGNPGNEKSDVNVPVAVTCKFESLSVPGGQIPVVQSIGLIVPALSQVQTKELVTVRLETGCPLF